MHRLEKRSLSIAGHRTSLALEAEFWAVLDQSAKREGVSLASLIAEIDLRRAQNAPDRPLASACRVYALAAAKGEPVAWRNAGSATDR